MRDNCHRILLMLFLFMGSLCDLNAANLSEIMLLDQLESELSEERYQASEKLSEIGVSNVDSVHRLIELSKKGVPGSLLVERNSSRWFAIELLGRLHILEAIPWLIQNIKLHDPSYKQAGQTQEILTFEYYFPASKALMIIGEPAISELCNFFLKSDDISRRELIAGTLSFIAREHQLTNQIKDQIIKYSSNEVIADKAFKEIKQFSRLYLPTVEDQL